MHFILFYITLYFVLHKGVDLFFVGKFIILFVMFLPRLESLEFRHALTIAANNNPEILIKKIDSQTKQYDIELAKAGKLPKVEIKGSSAKEYIRQSLRAGSLSSGVSGSSMQTTSDLSAVVTQVLFDGFKNKYEIIKTESDFKKAHFGYKNSLILVLYTVAQKYFEVRMFQRLTKIATKNLEIHKEILQKVRKLLEAGKVTKADIDIILARTSDAEVELQNFQSNLSIARASLRELVGFDIKILSKPKELINIPNTVNECIKLALTNNPALISCDASIASAAAEYSKSSSGFMPRVNLELRANRSFNAGGKKGVENNLKSAIVASFLPFNGFRDVVNRKKAKELMVSSKIYKQKLIRKIEKDIAVSFAEMIRYKAQSKHMDLSVKSKKRLLLAYKKQFYIGRRSFFDILSASNQYLQAKGALIRSDESYDISVLRVLSSTGLIFHIINLD